MPNFNTRPHAQALILLFIAMISMQGSGSLAKILFGQFSVLTVSVMRLLLGALILALLFKIWQINFRQVNWKAIISYGGALAGMNALFYLSLDRLPLGIAVSFEFIGPLSVALYHARQKFDFVWVGLGAPKQERWMAAHRHRIQAVTIGVGAAFDYHAGVIRRAPQWMQDIGLEWLHRFWSEPRRLGPRYLTTNTEFLYRAARQLLARR